ncbi:MAG: hypothetical protein JW986_01350, partial [Methanotrichaceae archaeon]|nr:hypothetical protein [Methanotrichaceae archaeon]
MIRYRHLDAVLLIAMTLIFSALLTISASGEPDGQLPIINGIDADLASPQDVGAVIIWRASAMDPDGDTLEYKFLLMGPSTDNKWEDQRGWSDDPSWTWRTTLADVGANQVEVQVRDGVDDIDDDFDVSETARFTITAPNEPPRINAFEPDAASPQIAGTPITWTASASDPEDPVQYMFLVDGQP